MAQEQIKTVADMMTALQGEIEAVKAGTITESLARVVFSGRKLQIKTAELQLQYKRISRSRKPDTDGDTPLLMAVG